MEREALVKMLQKEGYLRSVHLRDAFHHIDRREFVHEEKKHEAYENAPALIGFGRLMLQPQTAAFMLELVEPKLGERIMCIGAGAGWFTALLAYAVAGKGDADAPTGRVVAIEPREELSEIATKNLEQYHMMSNGIVEVIHGSGKEGAPEEAPFDKIVSTLAFDEIPRTWKEETRIGGRIVTPMGERIVVLDKTGPDTFRSREYFGFDFPSGE